MNNLMKILETIVSALKIYIDKFAEKIPTKVGQLENDVEYTTKEYVDSNTLTSDDAVALLAETGFVEPASNNGYVFTDEDNVIYTF